MNKSSIGNSADTNTLVAADGDKTLLLRFKMKQLADENEIALLSGFYWSAFFGKRDKIRSMIIDYKWSPFIRTRRMKRNVLTAAIIGKRDDIVEAILSRDFMSTPDNQYYIDSLYRGYDRQGRTPMHYAYLNNDDSII